jgi:hypothetical protein
MIEFYGGYQVYSESGIDLTLLRENLKRSATERLLKNQRMLPLIEALRQSGCAKFPGEPQGVRRAGMVEPEALLRQLADHHVEYVMIGGLAMVVHGSAHITNDLDVCYSRTQENITALAAAFAPLHPYLRGVPPGLPFHFDVPTILAGLNFTLSTDFGDVDVLGEVTGIGMYEQAFAQSEEKTVYGLKFRVLSLDALLVSKRAAGRIKDRNHILELEELKKMRGESS